MEEERNVLASRENVIKKTLINKIQELTRAEKEMKKMPCKIFWLNSLWPVKNKHIDLSTCKLT